MKKTVLDKELINLIDEYVDDDIVNANPNNSVVVNTDQKLRRRMSKESIKGDFDHYRGALASILKRKYRGSRANKAISYLYMKLYSTQGEDSLKKVVRDANIEAKKKNPNRIKHKKDILSEVNAPKLRVYHIKTKDGYDLLTREG